MSTTTDLPTLLRFLTQDAKVPLATALASVQALQKANLTSIDNISKAKPEELQQIFQQEDAKISKSVLNAAKKRTSSSKKRAANDVDNEDNLFSSPKKKKSSANSNTSIFSLQQEPSAQTPASYEASLQLPQTIPATSNLSDLSQVILFTNRAPLLLAFVFVLLKHTMPEQPVSSRLSLAQAYVSMTSRGRAVELGIRKRGGDREEEVEGGLGTASVRVMGREVRVLRRWGYDWGGEEEKSHHAGGLEEEPVQGDGGGGEGEEQVKSQHHDDHGDHDEHLPSEEQQQQQQQQSPALWGLDLEALSNSSSSAASSSAPKPKPNPSNPTNLPIHTPESARSYLMKSFDTPPPPPSQSPSTTTATQPSKKRNPAIANKSAEKSRNLAHLLYALDLLFSSWIGSLGPEELDRRVWGWYVRVRPAVEQGVAGWGGKGEVRLGEILALRRGEGS